MLINRSILSVKDNSGVLRVRCIQAQRSKKGVKPCLIGDFLKASVQKMSALVASSARRSNLTVDQRLRNYVVIMTKKALRRYDGSALRFYANCGVTLSEKKLPLFKRVNGIVPYELKKKGAPFLNMARMVI